MFKKGLHIITKEGYKGLLRVLYKFISKQENSLKALNTLSLIEALDFTPLELERNKKLILEFQRKRPLIKSVNWFIPYFTHVYYGGIYTILRFADYFLKEKELETRIVIYDNPYVSEENIKEKIKNVFPCLAERIYIYRGPDINVVPYADISVATLWTSAYQLLKFNNTLGKFYFIQDYEPLFYPAGSYYALSEATYRFGFLGIINTPGLYEFIKNKYGMKAEYFIPAVDKKIFYPKKSFNYKRNRLFIYTRPQHDRNAFELAIATAKKLKTVLGENIEIISAGSEWDPQSIGVEGIVENKGLLSYEETAKLYRECNFGLIFMFTKHPSYITLELMASGAIVVTNYNDANEWLLKDGENCIIVEPSPTCIVEKIKHLIDNPEVQRVIRDNAIKTVSSVDWNSEIEKIYKFITQSL